MDHVHELGSAVSRFTELIDRATGDEHVPSCPGWTTRALVTHLGAVHRWAAATVLSGQRLDALTPVATEPLVDWYAGTAEALLAALRAVDPQEPVPNFSRIDERAAFWSRRQAHETTVHAVDAAQALGHDEGDWTVDAALAADGVDEVLQVFFPRLTARGRRPDVRNRIRLLASDTGQSWLIAPGSSETSPPLQLHPSYDEDAVVRGTAHELYLALWNRLDHERLEFEDFGGWEMFSGVTTP
jgi:uncharacterized protein (TIGR03083 family)